MSRLIEDTDGVMADSAESFANAIIGRRIIKAERAEVKNPWGPATSNLTLTLDDGRRVSLVDGVDCCAYTEVEEFFLDPSAVDHVILGVGTTDNYETWHIFADLGDIMRLKVGWSEGSGYYSYGFNVQVEEVSG